MSVDGQALRQAMARFATGVTVVLSELDGQVHGMTANAVASVSLDPPLLLVCVGRGRRMHGVLEQAGSFTVSVLAEDQEHLSRYFAGQWDLLRPEEVPLDRTRGTAHPVLAGSLAWLDCLVVAAYPGGDHTIFLGRVERAGWAEEGRPLLFFRSRYARLG